jgi:transcriptional regulator with XRE-family HTH domain
MDAPTLIRETRRLRGWTQAELAARLGIAQSAVARLESGRASPRVASLARIFEVAQVRARVELIDDLGVERDQLLERLRWTPAERLRYLTDMVSFEARARRARRIA